MLPSPPTPHHDTARVPLHAIKGRGAASQLAHRFTTDPREAFDDGWGSLEAPAEGEEAAPLRTELRWEQARSALSRHQSPDLPFHMGLNPYRGCEHGCIYCYARPSHCYLGHSAGLDFETKLYAKPNAAALLEREFKKPSYRPHTIALGGNTDPYQPIERERRITRSILEVMAQTNHPVGIITKSALVARDIDLLAPMAEKNLARVAVSITTLDRRVARAMEPRAATPSKRLETVKKLADAGIPVTVMVAPIIPGLTDHEIEPILEAAREAGACNAGYVLLRLPLEIKDLFREWLAEEFPNRADRVISLLRSMHGGRDYTPDFGVRQVGRGPYATQIALRFRLAKKRLGLGEERVALRTDLFLRPGNGGQQLSLL